ncbi:hypothetical protein [Terrabacter sp. NPDC080008]|uniref:hypothetical protein n=1 Tax=Terrabacter sp. NPDC080008 TaxID=3155176 RepID=UPI00344CB122
MRATIVGAQEAGAAGVLGDGEALGEAPLDVTEPVGVGEEALGVSGLVGIWVLESCGVDAVGAALGVGLELQAAAREVAAATRTATLKVGVRSRRRWLWRIDRAYPAKPPLSACHPGVRAGTLPR